MIDIQLAEGDSVERALRALKKQVVRSGLLKELRRRRHYIKPSEARQLKMAAAKRRARSNGRESRSSR